MPGLPLREVVRFVTSRAAIIMGKADEIGSLRPGLAADVTMLRWTDGEFALRGGDGAARTMTRLLVPQLTAAWANPSAVASGGTGRPQ